MKLEELARPSVLAMPGYNPGPSVEELRREHGLDELAEMATNENAWGSSPLALEAIGRSLDRVSRYPDPSGAKLRTALAGRLGVDPEMIVLGNGADNLLLILGLCFLSPQVEVVAAELTFPVYRKVAALTGAVLRQVPLKNWTHDLEGMAKAVNEQTRMVLLCNPNNPTGTIVPPGEIMDFVRSLPGHVVAVLDEVYLEFVEPELRPSSLELIQDGRPVISLDSFSKLYGLAGLRIGYSVSPPEIAAQLAKVKEPFAVNSLAQAAALAALEDREFKERTVQGVARQREILLQGLAGLGLSCARSHTNFVFADLGRPADAVCLELLRHGVQIRSMAVWGEPNCARITVGQAEQNIKLLGELGRILD